MPSNINYENIDALFPVAGVDNSTQGFRDNFNLIKNSLMAAREEILQLQSTALLKTPIPVTGVLDNNLAGSELLNAKMTRATDKKSETVVIPVEGPNPINAYFTQGHYHTFVVNTSVQLLLNWSDLENTDTDGVQRMRVELVHGGDSNTHTITIANTSVKYSHDWPSPLQLTETIRNIVLEFWIYKESGNNNPGNTPLNPITYAKYIGSFD